MNMMERRFKYGILLGVSPSIAESIVGTKDRIVKSSVVRRLLEENRWGSTMAKEIRGIPLDLVSNEELEVQIGGNPDIQEAVPPELAELEKKRPGY